MKTPHWHMMTRLCRSTIAGALLCGALVLRPATAQTSAPPVVFVLGEPEMKPDGHGSVRIYTNSPVTVMPANLVVRFGDQPAVNVRVQRDDTVPLHVVLGLDVSLWNPRDVAHTSALTRTVLAAQALVTAGAESSFSAFPFSMTLPSPATADVSWLQNARLWQGNYTALFAAVDAAAKQLAGVDTAKGRKVIVLLTNSGNTLNMDAPARRAFINSLQTAIKNAQEANAQVFVFVAEEKWHALSERTMGDLRALAQATVGDVITTTVATQLPGLVTNALAHQFTGYRVDFTSSVPVTAANALEIGLTSAALSNDQIEAQPPLAAGFVLPGAFLSPNSVVKLNIDQAWAKDIRRADVFINGRHVTTLLPSQLEFTWGEPAIKESIAALKPGEQAVLTASVEYGLNNVVVMKAPVTVPAKSALNLAVASAGQPADPLANLFADQAYTLTAQGQNIRDVTFVIVDAHGGETLRAGDPLAPTRVTLPAGSYTLQARAVDEWGRSVRSASVKQNVPFHITPLAIAVALLMLFMLIALCLVFLQRRRAAGRVESTYRLVNYGNAVMEFVVLADYNAGDFTLRFARMDATDEKPAEEARLDADGKLKLLTPPIAPQTSVLLHVIVVPARVRRLKQYDFQLLAYARPQNPAQPTVRPFTLRPLKQIAAPEQPV